MTWSVFISLPYNMATRTAGIDKNEEIMSLSPYVFNATICIRTVDCNNSRRLYSRRRG